MRFLLTIILFIGSFSLFAQQGDQRALAEQYYKQGEFEKAIDLFQKLWSKGQEHLDYSGYFYSLLALKDYDKAEKIAQKQLKSAPQYLAYYADLGSVYLFKNEPKKAEEQFKKAIKLLTADTRQIINLANAFQTIEQTDYALETYKKGQKLNNTSVLFADEIAAIYSRKGNIPSLVSMYLDVMQEVAAEELNVKNALQTYLKTSQDYAILESQLYKKIQKSSVNEMIFTDLLIWSLIQVKDFEGALLQAKAIDKRWNEDGSRINDIAQLALIDKQFDTAIKAYQYLTEKIPRNYYYIPARKGILNSRKEKIINQAYTKDDIIALVKGYEDFIGEFQRDINTLQAIKELAEINALYIHDLERAIALLQDLLKSPLNERTKSEVKLQLGDYYLMDGNIWEATLLYSQVDKAMKDEPLGEEARFKNAKLAYYNGDFEWSQSQMDVLKASTSELIANDALNLSVFISDNTGFDSIMEPLAFFSRADLLLFQNKNALAERTLDSINILYLGHEIADDILLAKYRIALKDKSYDRAASYLTKITEDYSAGLLADDAIYLLAELNERYLNKPDVAMNLYEKLILDYSGSVYITEARKRFRKLRGDFN